MEFVFRKLDPDNPEDIRQFNELMDELSCQAENQELLRERIRDMNGKEDRFLMAARERNRKAVRLADGCDIRGFLR